MITRRPTILIVDDEPDVTRSLHGLLRYEYRVLTCSSGPEAVRVLESSQDIQVVMSDQRMPGMAGVEFLSQASRLRPDATRLLMTAYSDVSAVIDAINKGSVFRYVTKPWEPEELRAVLRQAVERHDLIVDKARLMAELAETNRRLVEADRLKGMFLEVVSHELNTPVAVVQGMTQLWSLTQSPGASPADRKWVERIQTAGRRLSATVERMLKLTRSDQLIDPLGLQRTDLSRLTREAAETLTPFLEARGQRVEFDLDPPPGEALVDPDKIGDALTNLLINAVKFSPDGQTVRVAARPVGADRVRFEVTDQGVGIPHEAQAHLFEPFFTGFDTLHHSSGDYEFGKRGIGLGLALVKRFVELHGGSVEVRSTPGEGSTFAFTLPRQPPDSITARLTHSR